MHGHCTPLPLLGRLPFLTNLAVGKFRGNSCRFPFFPSHQLSGAQTNQARDALESVREGEKNNKHWIKTAQWFAAIGQPLANQAPLAR